MLTIQECGRQPRPDNSGQLGGGGFSSGGSGGFTSGGSGGFSSGGGGFSSGGGGFSSVNQFGRPNSNQLLPEVQCRSVLYSVVQYCTLPFGYTK